MSVESAIKRPLTGRIGPSVRAALCVVAHHMGDRRGR